MDAAIGPTALRREARICLETVTPAFIGTSDLARAEWSAKGIRGELRWWFRAVAGGELGGDAQRTRSLELSVFGGLGNDSGSACASPLRVLAQTIDIKKSAGSEVPGKALDDSGVAEAWENTKPAVKDRLRLAGGGRTNPLGYLGYGP